MLSFLICRFSFDFWRLCRLCLFAEDYRPFCKIFSKQKNIFSIDLAVCVTVSTDQIYRYIPFCDVFSEQQNIFCVDLAVAVDIAYLAFGVKQFIVDAVFDSIVVGGAVLVAVEYKVGNLFFVIGFFIIGIAESGSADRFNALGYSYRLEVRAVVKCIVFDNFNAFGEGDFG